MFDITDSIRELKERMENYNEAHIIAGKKYE